jgi:hypothetical protein
MLNLPEDEESSHQRHQDVGRNRGKQSKAVGQSER